MTKSYLKSRLSALPFSVWLDGEARVRRLRYETTGPGRETPVHRRLDFFDFGAPVDRPGISPQTASAVLTGARARTGNDEPQ